MEDYEETTLAFSFIHGEYFLVESCMAGPPYRAVGSLRVVHIHVPVRTPQGLAAIDEGHEQIFINGVFDERHLYCFRYLGREAPYS